MHSVTREQFDERWAQVVPLVRVEPTQAQ